MDRLAREREATCRFVPAFDWARVGPPPWTPLEGGLRSRRVALVTSGGFYLRGRQPPFDGEPSRTDPSIRLLPVGVRPEAVGISHRFYDRRHVREDLETMMPVRALEGAAGEGLLGSLCDQVVSFLGYLPHWDRIETELAPAVLRALRDLGASAVLLSPG